MLNPRSSGLSFRFNPRLPDLQKRPYIANGQVVKRQGVMNTGVSTVELLLEPG